MPGNKTDEVIQLYKERLGNIIKEIKKNVPKVTLITSHNDNSYYEHIPPLISLFKEKGVQYICICNDELYITRHNNVVANCLNEIYYCVVKWLVGA